MSGPGQDGARPDEYFRGLNLLLAGAVPQAVRRILEVGCAEGRLGAHLKSLDPSRTVIGLELEPGPAAEAAKRLDQVLVQDAEASLADLEPGSLDCILYGDVLEHFRDPLNVLLRHRALLAPGGTVLCCVPNVQHHTLASSLLRGDWQPEAAGLLDRGHLRFFSHLSLLRMFLDAGFLPEVAAAFNVPAAEGFHAAARPLLEHLGLDSERLKPFLDVAQWIVRAMLPSAAPVCVVPPLTLVTRSSEPALLMANLGRSPCLGPGTPHELLVFPESMPFAEAARRALECARHSLVLVLDQNAYLPVGFLERFLGGWNAAEQRLGSRPLAGVHGWFVGENGLEEAGRFVDGLRLCAGTTVLPCRALALDEPLLALRRGEVPVPDLSLGRHWAVGLCLEMGRRGQEPLVLDAPMHWAADFRPSAAAGSLRDAHALRARYPDIPPELMDRLGPKPGRP